MDQWPVLEIISFFDAKTPLAGLLSEKCLVEMLNSIGTFTPLERRGEGAIQSGEHV